MDRRGRVVLSHVFSVSPEQLASTHLEMVFEGLDTSAEVFVNDKSVLKADNMFRTWRIDAKPLVHSGANSLRIEFSLSSRSETK
jgi:beta-mannosidase